MKTKLIYKATLLMLTTFCFQFQVLAQTNEPTEFSRYTALIGEINLPISSICYEDLNFVDVDYDNEFVQKFKPEGAGILGKIKISESVLAIIYTYPADYVFPILSTFDNNGQKIAELRLYEGYCGRDYDFSSSSFFKINPNLLINRIDSTRTYNLDEQDEIIGIKSQSVKSSDYQLSDKGNITKK